MHWITHSLTHSLIRSLIHIHTYSLTPITHSFTPSLARSLIHSHIHSLMHSFTHSPTHSYPHSLTYIHIHSFTHSLLLTSTHSLFDNRCCQIGVNKHNMQNATQICKSDVWFQGKSGVHPEYVRLYLEYAMYLPCCQVYGQLNYESKSGSK